MFSVCYRYADVAELADALDLGSSGRPCRFNSCHPHFSLENKGIQEVCASWILLRFWSLTSTVTSTGEF